MSMMSSLLENLRSYADEYEYIPVGILYEAADTIEVLSAKLTATNERSRQYGDWIPCDERLPEEDVKVLIWYEDYRYDLKCMEKTYGIGWYSQGIWYGDIGGVDAKCLAWMPLPKPYKKKQG